MSVLVPPFAGNSRSVVIVGAGIAGITAAAVLGRNDYCVTLVDSRPTCPHIFKAEKLEADQAELLGKLGLLSVATHSAARISQIVSCYRGRHVKTSRAEQYGFFYSDMVDSLRASLPETVRFKLGRVAQIENSDDIQRVKVDDGEELTARLVVLACGLNGEIPASLGLKRISVKKRHSVALAFTIARADGQPFPFDSVTCYPDSLRATIDYLTLFTMPQAMRANLFAFPDESDDLARRFIQEPEIELNRAFPMLARIIGDYRVVSRVETSLIHLYRTENAIVPGVVLIGDVAQNACPSTGMGLSKVLTDVDVLCTDCIPRWFESAGMGCDKVAQFWSNSRKRRVDSDALGSAIYRRRARMERSPRWVLHRTRLSLSMRFGRQNKL